MSIWLFALLAAVAVLTGCTETPEKNMGAAVDNDQNVLTGGPITGTTLQDLPGRVKKTLRDRAPRAEIISIERRIYGRQLVYDITFTEPEKNQELYVREDGRVLPESAKEQK